MTSTWRSPSELETPFHGRAGRNGEGASVALVAVSRVDHLCKGLVGRNDDIGNPDWRAIPKTRVKIGVEASVASNRGDIVAGVFRYGKLVDRCVPDVVSRKDRAAADHWSGGGWLGKG